MVQATVCMLHPGEMGSAVARTARAGGARVLWISAGRGEATRKRADAAGLEDVGTLRDALRAAEFVLSVCPPHAAVTVAESVAAHGFRGVYLDANAVSPDTTRRVGSIVEAAGATFVDGGIVGPPPATGGSTRLYLSGPNAGRVAELFAGSPLAAIVLDGPAGAASALKMCYAAWNKGASLLLAGICALADHEGVASALTAEWRLSQPEAFRRLDHVAASARKAWRWTAELEEIAATFAGAGLPAGFGKAGADVCRRLESFKDARGTAIEEVVAALLAKPGRGKVAAGHSD